jgi:thioredoxin 1
MATKLTAENFESAVSNGVSLVDFWAEWCMPCKTLSPVIDRLHEKFGERAVVAKVDVDQEPDLGAKYSIRSIPTVIIMKDGNVVERITGPQPESRYADIIESLIDGEKN